VAEQREAQPVILVTGSSRGIGAETARLLARHAGARLVINYRDKSRRAEQVVAEITSAGGAAVAMRADLTSPQAVAGMLDGIKARYGRLDVLVLNASGGMERDARPGYALRLNRDAQVNLATQAAELMPRGSRIIFVTSHQAHFHGQRPGPPAYEAVAQSKRAGEDALRALIPELSARGISLTVISGDMIEGTITVLLLERANRGIVEARREQVGRIPTVEEFAAAVATAATSEHPTGHTIYVGGPDYLGLRL
jgi:3-oxoacyl-[acyl-carrier protein] reductase